MVAAVREAQGGNESDDDTQQRTQRKTSDQELEKELKGLIAKAGKAHKMFMIRGDVLKHKHVYDPRQRQSTNESVKQCGLACVDAQSLANDGAHDEDVASCPRQLRQSDRQQRKE